MSNTGCSAEAREWYALTRDDDMTTYPGHGDHGLLEARENRMSTQVTVTLPDDIYRRAEHLAHLTGRDIADVLADTIGLSLEPLGRQRTGDPAVTDLSDSGVTALAESQMDAAQERRFSDLLNQQQTGCLTDEDRQALLALMQAYQDGLLRKAQALHEAVRRGLRPPLEA